ncbi:hypothetical protein HMPREF1581_01532 [Gardnerella vaginalis JCP8108]|uniref:Uncharacterized protein n=1 Tax=Gardnerella vaginalis JCP8108 TaxID=1261066 RepID=S4GT33_GARVA|nr:hypothetical protein HMPREF1581_01532 [Gardnerella vaginalis JCP8108]
MSYSGHAQGTEEGARKHKIVDFKRVCRDFLKLPRIKKTS